jgi:2'-5' RNA ligase
VAGDMGMSVSASVTRMRTHWRSRPQWADGARRYAWHLTFEDCVELHRTVAALQDAIRPASQLDMVPVDRLHLTLADVGSNADVSLVRARRHATEVFGRSSTVGARALVFTRVTVVAEGVVLEPSAAPWLDELARLVGETPDRPVWPHVSLAYSHANGDPEAVLALLRTAETVPPTVTRPRLTLTEQRRETRAYAWEVVFQRPLTCG